MAKGPFYRGDNPFGVDHTSQSEPPPASSFYPEVGKKYRFTDASNYKGVAEVLGYALTNAGPPAWVYLKYDADEAESIVLPWHAIRGIKPLTDNEPAEEPSAE